MIYTTIYILGIILSYIISRNHIRKDNDDYNWLDVRIILMLSILWIISAPILLILYLYDIITYKLIKSKPPKWL